jgi:hypothetical protein
VKSGFCNSWDDGVNIPGRMNGFLRQRSRPAIPFLIAGILFAGARVFATQPLGPAIGVMARSHYMELSWLGVGVLVCWLYAILYYVSAQFLNLSVSLGLSLLHLLVTISAVFGLGQLHYIGIRTEQSPTSYPALAFLGVNAYALLLIGGLLFLAILMFSWPLKRPAASR